MFSQQTRIPAWRECQMKGLRIDREAEQSLKKLQTPHQISSSTAGREKAAQRRENIQKIPSPDESPPYFNTC